MGYFFNIVFLKSSCTLNLFGELPKIQRSRLHPTYSNLFDLQGILGMVWFLKVPYFSSVQPLSHVWLFVTPWTAARQASLSITNSQSLLRLMSIESVMPSNHLILYHPLLLLPLIFPSIRVFSSESVLYIKWLNYWSFSFSISLSNEYSGLISFRMDWLDLLANPNLLNGDTNTNLVLL